LSFRTKVRYWTNHLFFPVKHRTQAALSKQNAPEKIQETVDGLQSLLHTWNCSKKTERTAVATHARPEELRNYAEEKTTTQATSAAVD